VGLSFDDIVKYANVLRDVDVALNEAPVTPVHGHSTIASVVVLPLVSPRSGCYEVLVVNLS